jgi:hypothetical protein
MAWHPPLRSPRDQSRWQAGIAYPPKRTAKNLCYTAHNLEATGIASRPLMHLWHTENESGLRGIE